MPEQGRLRAVNGRLEGLNVTLWVAAINPFLLPWKLQQKSSMLHLECGI